MLWLWGLAGAFSYGGQKWIICMSAVRDPAHNPMICTMELAVTLVVGCIAAAAFGPLASHYILTTLHIKDDNAVCVVIGLFANRVAPDVVEKGASAFNGGASVVGRILRALRGDEK